MALGIGDSSPTAKVKPLDEVSVGAKITPDAAKQLASFLEKTIAQYDKKDKTNSIYMDFQFLTNGEVVEKSDKTPEENIVVRFQYVYNAVDLEDAELTLCYFGKSGSPVKLVYDDVKTLIGNLQKN